VLDCSLLYIPFFNWIGFDSKTVGIPTGLFLNGITALSDTIYFLREKMIDIKDSLQMVIASFIVANIGAWVTYIISIDIWIILFAIGMIASGLK